MELVWREEVVDQQELDPTHFLYPHIKMALLPNSASADTANATITDIADGATYQYDAGGLAANPDGSYRRTSYTAAPFVAMDSPVDMFNQSAVVFAELHVNSATAGNTLTPMFGFTSPGGNAFNVRNHGYGSGVSVTFQYKYSSAAGLSVHNIVLPMGSGRATIVMHWDHVSRTFRTWVNGALTLTGTKADATSDALLQNKIATLTPPATDAAFYSGFAAALPNALTEQQMQELVDNPYSVFRTAEDQRQEQQLALSLSSQITAPAITLSNNKWAVKFRMVSTHGQGTTYIKNLFFIDNNNKLEIYQNWSGWVRVQLYIGGESVAYQSGSTGPLSTVAATAEVRCDNGAVEIVVNDVTVASGTLTSTLLPGSFTELFKNCAINLHFLQFYDVNDLVRYYIPRTGDTTLFEAINGQHGTLVGGPTIEPVVPSVEFDVAGGENDYPTLGAAVAAQNMNPDRRVLTLKADTTEAGILENAWGANTEMVIQGDLPFDGSKASARNFTCSSGRAFDFRNLTAANPVVIKNLAIIGNGSNTVVNPLAGSYPVTVQDCYINSGGIGLFNVSRVFRCAIRAAGRGVYVSELVTGNIVHSLGTTSPDGRALQDVTSAYNNMLITDNAEVAFNVTSDQHNHKTNSSVLASAFVDAANGDYRINQAWADANLVGQGWNGSDIAAWSYFAQQVSNDLQMLAARQRNRAGTSSISQIHQLAGHIARQVNRAKMLSLESAALLDLLTGRQVNRAATLTLAQLHGLGTQIARQVNRAAQGSLAQQHELAARAARQINRALSLSLGQIHQLNGSSSRQVNRALLLSLEQQGGLVSQIARQINRGVSLTLLQQHLLSGTTARQRNLAKSLLVSQTHSLNMGSAKQVNRALSQSIEQIHQLYGSKGRQPNRAKLVSLTVFAALLANSARQINRGGGVALLQVHELNPAIARQVNRAVPMRLFSGLLNPIDPDALALLDITDQFALSNQTDSFSLSN